VHPVIGTNQMVSWRRNPILAAEMSRDDRITAGRSMS
jgi:hypothetical protein